MPLCKRNNQTKRFPGTSQVIASNLFLESQSGESVQITSRLNRSTLLIAEASVEHAGVYRVKAENVVGSIASTATLSVEQKLQLADMKPPVIVRELAPVKVMDGEEVNLSCQVTEIKDLPIEFIVMTEMALKWIHFFFNFAKFG